MVRALLCTTLLFVVVVCSQGTSNINRLRSAIKLTPNDAERHQSLGNLYCQGNQDDKCFRSWKKAAKLKPSLRPLLLTQKGQVLESKGHAVEAIEAYEKAGSPDVRPRIAKLFRSATNAWHFMMMNDHKRNRAYERALQRSIKPGMLVLDIGSGSGLLAMLAIKAGAAHVITCEAKPLLALLARRIIQQNGMASKITVLNKLSTQLQVGEGRDLPRKVDLVVSEILESEIIGEGMLPTMRDAIARLANPGAVIIPERLGE
jgi:type II protein arginine methyltransferase